MTPNEIRKAILEKLGESRRARNEYELAIQLGVHVTDIRIALRELYKARKVLIQPETWKLAP